MSAAPATFAFGGWVLGREHPWSDLFSVDRVTLRGGLRDYLRENFDYPYYLLSDRFASSDAASLAK